MRRYGDIPVCLAGHGMGGRAALRAGGHPAVTSVLAMAPWLPGSEAPEPEPVKHLAGRRVLIVHGTNDSRTDPELSYRLAERTKKANRDTCRFEVHSDGHALRQHRAEVVALAADFIRGSLFAGSYARPVADAFAAPPPLGLRMPLAAGSGSRCGTERPCGSSCRASVREQVPPARQQEVFEGGHRRRVRVAVQPCDPDLTGGARSRDRQFDHTRPGDRGRREQGHPEPGRDQAAQRLGLLPSNATRGVNPASAQRSSVIRRRP